MRIACDLDGTLADMTTALYREADVLFGVKLEVRHEVVVFEEPATPAAPPAVANDGPAGPLDLDALMAAPPVSPLPAPSAPAPAVPAEPRRADIAAAERAVTEEHPSMADAIIAVTQEAPGLATARTESRGQKTESGEASPAAETAARPQIPATTATPRAATDADEDEEDEAGGPRLTRAQQQKLWAHVRGMEDFWAGLSEIEPGAVARLGALANEHQWDVIFVTERPPSAGDRVQVQSQRWLEAHGFDYPSVFVVAGSRGRIADALQLDVVIDDRPEHCLDVALDSRALAILVWRDDPARLPAGVARHGIEVVTTFSQALAKVLQLQAARRGARGGILGSLKRALRFGK